MNWFNTTKRGYRFHRGIAWGGMIIIMSLAIYLMYIDNFDFSSTNIYFKCYEKQCKNPLFDMQNCQQQLNILWVIPMYKAKTCQESCTWDWCDKEYLPMGEYGKKPSSLFPYMYPLTLAVIVAIILLNHFIYNRGKKFDVEIPFTKKKRLNVRDILNKFDESNKNNSNK